MKLQKKVSGASSCPSDANHCCQKVAAQLFIKPLRACCHSPTAFRAVHCHSVLVCFRDQCLGSWVTQGHSTIEVVNLGMDPPLPGSCSWNFL